MSLLQLPEELLAQITKWIPVSDIFNFAIQSRRLYNISSPLLRYERRLYTRYSEIDIGPAWDGFPHRLQPPTSKHDNVFTFFKAISHDDRFNYAKHLRISLDNWPHYRFNPLFYPYGLDASINVGRPHTSECDDLQHRLDDLGVPLQAVEYALRTNSIPCLPDMLRLTSHHGHGETFFAAMFPLLSGLRHITFCLTQRSEGLSTKWTHIDPFMNFIASTEPQTYLTKLDSLTWHARHESTLVKVIPFMALSSLRKLQLENASDGTSWFTWPEDLPKSRVEEVAFNGKTKRLSVLNFMGALRGPCTLKYSDVGFGQPSEDMAQRTAIIPFEGAGKADWIFQ